MASKESVIELFSTLASPNDKVWPHEYWPKIRFKDGLHQEAQGGHGPIRYQVIGYDPSHFITFKFERPFGFHGFHKFEITEISRSETQVQHTIDIQTSGLGTMKWLFAIRWLHDALIEDAFDKIENQINNKQVKARWSIWVKILRVILK